MKKITLLVALGLCLNLMACKTVTKKDLGLVKESPNEFMVMSRAPLSLPPEYDVRPVNDSESRAAQVSAKGKFDNLSQGERGFMRAIGAQYNNDNIRAEVTEEMKAAYE